MKKRNRFAAAALAALLLAGSAPSALALDATPPMYQQFGYDSAEEYMEQESSYGVFDYDTSVTIIGSTWTPSIKIPRSQSITGGMTIWRGCPSAGTVI